MEKLDINPSITTPLISFDPFKMDFTIKGECRPENVLTFFNPILDWVNDFKAWVKESQNSSKDLIFNFELEYYNSSSAKFIFNLLKRLRALDVFGVNLKVNFYYDILDDDLLENGKEFEKILNAKFTFIAVED